MKAVLVLDQDAVPSAAPDNYLKKIKPVSRKGCAKPVFVYPKGTEFEGEQALLLVLRGQAHPADDECLKACGKSQAELRAMQAAYELTHSGINSEQDRDLALAGVILGYDEKDNPIPGPKWPEYQAALKTLMEDEDDE